MFEEVAAFTPLSGPENPNALSELVKIPEPTPDEISRCVDDPSMLSERKNGLATLVVDLDETLVKTALGSGHIYVRPNARYFLETIAFLRAPGVFPTCEGHVVKIFEVIVWSAGVREHVDNCLRILDPKRIFVDHAICRGDSWMPCGSIVLKDLSLLPGRAASAFIIDDSVYTAVRSGGRALVVPPFNPLSGNDTTLLFAAQVVAHVALVLTADRIDRAPDAGGEAFSGEVVCDVRAVDQTAPLPLIVAATNAARVLRAMRAMPDDISKRHDLPEGANIEMVCPASARTCQCPRVLMPKETDVTNRSAVTIASLVSRVLRQKVVCSKEVDFDRLYELDPMSSRRELDEGAIPSILQGHPFVARKAVGNINALMLDVDDESVIGARIASRLDTFAPRKLSVDLVTTVNALRERLARLEKAVIDLNTECVAIQDFSDDTVFDAFRPVKFCDSVLFCI